MQIGFYFDQTRCTGCSACRVACKDWNDVPAGPENWMRVLYTEKGKFPRPFVSYMIAPCWHCAEPLCAAACPVDAITKRAEDGIVLVDSEICLGNAECDLKCLKACPYDAPQFGPENNAKMHASRRRPIDKAQHTWVYEHLSEAVLYLNLKNQMRIPLCGATQPLGLRWGFETTSKQCQGCNRMSLYKDHQTPRKGTET